MDNDEFIDEKIREEINDRHENDTLEISSGAYVNNEFFQFTRRNFYDNKLSILIPDSFMHMPPDLAKIKYPSSDRPQIILSNIDTTVNFNFTYHVEKGSEFKDSFCPDVRDYIKLITTKTNLTNESIEVEDIYGVNVPVSLFCYRSLAIDAAVFNINFVSCIDNYALFGLFNCSYRDSENWYPVARQMISSICDETRKSADSKGDANE